MSLRTKKKPEPAPAPVVVKLTSGQRLARGFKSAALAPIDISRGTAGLGFGLVKAGSGILRRGKSAAADVQEVVAEAAESLADEKGKRKLPRRLLRLALLGVVGAAVAKAVSKSGQAEPTPLAPSVDPNPQT